MAETILVIAEQREGKLNRVSWETVAAAQAIAAETGATVEAAIFGSGVAGIGQEIAAKKLARVTVIDSPKLARYEPDGVVAALKDFINQKKPTRVLLPHTSQVRHFAPQLATALQRTLISDAIGFRKDGDKLVFTRQMFQGKFAADVSFACPAPHFVTFQAGAFRGDKAEAGASPAPVATENDNIAERIQ